MACMHVAIKCNSIALQDPEDYGEVLGALREGGDAGPPAELRRRLAWKAFQHCATYDSTVAEWLWGQIGVSYLEHTQLAILNSHEGNTAYLKVANSAPPA